MKSNAYLYTNIMKVIQNDLCRGNISKDEIHWSISSDYGILGYVTSISIYLVVFK